MKTVLAVLLGVLTVLMARRIDQVAPEAPQAARALLKRYATWAGVIVGGSLLVRETTPGILMAFVFLALWWTGGLTWLSTELGLPVQVPPWPRGGGEGEEEGEGGCPPGWVQVGPLCVDESRVP